MDNEPHFNIPLPDRSYQALARSSIKKIAEEIGFKKNRLAQLEIIIAEITSNLVKHSKNGGHILAKKITLKETQGIELISIDNGPGMDLPQKMIEDGVSTTKTLGHGLGAIRRLSDEFDIYSLKNWGTILLSRFFLKELNYSRPEAIECKVVMVPKEGETLCGDASDAIIKGQNIKIILADGLGHGADAHKSAQQAIDFFKMNSKLPPNELLREMHAAIKRTRGAVVNVSHIDFKSQQFIYSGVGNINSKIVSPSRTKSCVSYNGIVGHSIPNTLNNHVQEYDTGDMIILSSDGISTRWDIQKYPSLIRHDGTIIATVLYKDYSRKNDDVSVVVIRLKKK